MKRSISFSLKLGVTASAALYLLPLSAMAAPQPIVVGLGGFTQAFLVKARTGDPNLLGGTAEQRRNSEFVRMETAVKHVRANAFLDVDMAKKTFTYSMNDARTGKSDVYSETCTTLMQTGVPELTMMFGGVSGLKTYRGTCNGRKISFANAGALTYIIGADGTGTHRNSVRIPILVEETFKTGANTLKKTTMKALEVGYNAINRKIEVLPFSDVKVTFLSSVGGGVNLTYPQVSKSLSDYRQLSATDKWNIPQKSQGSYIIPLGQGLNDLNNENLVHRYVGASLQEGGQGKFKFVWSQVPFESVVTTFSQTVSGLPLFNTLSDGTRVGYFDEAKGMPYLSCTGASCK